MCNSFWYWKKLERRKFVSTLPYFQGVFTKKGMLWIWKFHLSSRTASVLSRETYLRDFICLHRNKITRPYQLVEIQFENRYDGIRLAGKLGQITCAIDTTQKLSCSKSFWFTTSFKILNTYNYSRIKAPSQIFDSVPNTFLRRAA